MQKLNGAWEPRGYLGPRAEIRGRKLIRLWRSSPVLETGFSTEREDDRLLLKLEKTELQYAGSDRPYASVRACWYKDGALTFVDDFPITGESTEVLYPTDHSRYGNVTIVDREYLPKLRGKWVSNDSSMTLCFRNGVMEIDHDGSVYRTVRIAVVRNKGDGEVRIINRDPACEELGMFAPLRWQGGTLHTYIPICDAAPGTIIFHR